MTAIYSLIVLISAIAFVVTTILLIGRGVTRRRLAIVIGSAAAFFVAASLNKPDATTVTTASTSQTPSPVAAAPSPVASTAPVLPVKSEPGVAKVCLTDGDVTFSGYREIRLPATLVFSDDGPLTEGRKEEPDSWRYEATMQHAAFKTLDPIILTKDKHCSEVKVQMYVAPLYSERSAKASDNHVFSISDVVDYPVPPQKPPIEVGKLIDDISVKAVLLTDVTQAVDEVRLPSDEASKATRCLEGAQRLAAALGGGIGRQTSMVVFLGGLPTGEASYGCSMGSKEDPNLFISWDKQARPPPATRNVIAKGGEFLTGATQAEMVRETNGCVVDALKPDAGEMGAREFRGVKIECQAFTRDGGAGSVTIYRRFGAYPTHQAPSTAALLAMQGASENIKADEAKQAAGAMSFAQWWQDPSIPKEVKTFAMMASRITALAERCPNWKPRPGTIEEMAASAGVSPSDIAPDGKYFDLMTETMRAMHDGTQKDSVETACEEARRYH